MIKLHKYYNYRRNQVHLNKRFYFYSITNFNPDPNLLGNIFGKNPVDLVYGPAFQKFGQLAKDNTGLWSKLYYAWQCGGMGFLSMVSIALWTANIVVSNNQLDKYLDSKSTKWTIAQNLLKMGVIAIQGTPKSFGALIFSIGSFGYSAYELIALCNTPIIKKPIGLLMVPINWAVKKFHYKLLTMIQHKVEQIIIKTNNVWLIPIFRFMSTGRFAITTRGLGSAEGFNIIKDFDNGLILKANGKYYTISTDTWHKLLEATKGMPSDYLSANLNNIFIKAGQEVPENMTVFMNKVLSQNISPEQIKQTLTDNNINFFSKDIPTEFIDYQMPYGNWEQVESFINILKENIPEQFQEFSAGRFIIYTIALAGAAFFGYIVLRDAYNSSKGLISTITGSCYSFGNYIWTSSINFWRWMNGKPPVSYTIEDVTNQSDIKEVLNTRYSQDKIIDLTKYNMNLDNHSKINTDPIYAKQHVQYKLEKLGTDKNYDKSINDFAFKKNLANNQISENIIDDKNLEPQLMRSNIKEIDNKIQSDLLEQQKITYKEPNYENLVYDGNKKSFYNIEKEEYIKEWNHLLEKKDKPNYLYPLNDIKNTIKDYAHKATYKFNNIIKNVDDTLDNFINPTLKTPSAPDLSDSKEEIKSFQNNNNSNINTKFDTELIDMNEILESNDELSESSVISLSKTDSDVDLTDNTKDLNELTLNDD